MTLDFAVVDAFRAAAARGHVSTFMGIHLAHAAISSRSHCQIEPTNRITNRIRPDTAFRIMYIMFKASPGGAGVPFASITLPCQAKKPASPACPSRPGSYGFLHRPIRVLYMTQAIQPQTKPTPATMISSSSKAAPFSP